MIKNILYYFSIIGILIGFVLIDEKRCSNNFKKGAINSLQYIETVIDSVWLKTEINGKPANGIRFKVLKQFLQETKCKYDSGFVFITIEKGK